MSLVAFIPLAAIVTAVLVPLLTSRERLSRIPVPVRALAGLGTLAVAAFCAFGILASFEPLDPVTQWGFRVGYSLTGLAAIAGAVRLFRARPGAASL